MHSKINYFAFKYRENQNIFIFGLTTLTPNQHNDKNYCIRTKTPH